MAENEITTLLKIYLVIVGALLPIVDPFGSAPFFLSMTTGGGPELRASLARRVAINSFLMLMGSLVLGHYVLRIFGLSIPVVQFAGGIVLCVLAAKMLFDDSSAAPTAPSSDLVLMGRSFYPLTLPLTIDPGSISVAITIGANHPHGLATEIAATVGATAGVLTIALSVWLCYRYADRVSGWLGQSRMQALLRLAAFIMFCIGAQIAWNGVKALLEDVTFRTAPMHPIEKQGSADRGGAELKPGRYVLASLSDE